VLRFIGASWEQQLNGAQISALPGKKTAIFPDSSTVALKLIM